ALNTIVDATGDVTYFELDSGGGGYGGYRVVKEVDPAGIVTYFNYDSMADYHLQSLNWGGRQVDFSDDGLSYSEGIPAQSASAMASGGSRHFIRFPVSYHGFGVSDQCIGGSHANFQYNGTNLQVSQQTDGNGQSLAFSINELHRRTAVGRPDGSSLYY